MKNYTVVWSHEADEELANLWLTASDRAGITQACSAIDQRLASEGASASSKSYEGLHSLLLHLCEYSLRSSNKIELFASGQCN